MIEFMFNQEFLDIFFHAWTKPAYRMCDITINTDCSNRNPCYMLGVTDCDCWFGVYWLLKEVLHD